MFDIRELLRHLREGRSARAIHRALGLGRPTIAKYRRWAEQEGLLSGPLPSLAEVQARLQASLPPAPPQTVSSVEPHRAAVLDLLARGLEIEALYQRLREDHGFTGKYSAVWRFVRKLEPQRPEATVRVEVPPGTEAQVDFGDAGRMFDPVQQKLRRAWAFVMTLSWSRHQYVEFVFDQRVPTWLTLHRHALEFFGGTPQRIVLDNLKAAIVQASWDDPQVQRAYRDCAEHYDFLISPCRPATPQHKGKVESGGVHYVKRNFLAGRDYTTAHHHLQHANQDALRWVRETAGQRKHGTTKQLPLPQFEAVERAALRPLPPEPFEVVTWKQVKLHRDCYLTFDNAYYSAPHRFLGEVLWVRGTAKTVQICREFEVIATHSRATQPGQRQTVLAHLPPEKVVGLTLTPQACLERAAQIGPRTAEAVAHLLAERPIDRLRAVHRLLGRSEKGDPARLERACDRALTFGDVSIRTIENILKTGVADQPLPDTTAEPAPGWPRFAREAEDLVPAHLRR
jgi:transposase